MLLSLSPARQAAISLAAAFFVSLMMVSAAVGPLPLA